MAKYKDLIYFIAVLCINIDAGRRFSYYPSLHKVRLSKKVRKLLYIVDIADFGYCEISIVGFIWQIMFIVTTLACCIAWLIFRFDFLKLYTFVSLCEWLLVGLPLGIYSGISEIILKKRGEL